MKFAALIVLAILGAANASLRDDIDDLKALIPIEEIKELTREFAANDAEFRQALAYIRSEEFLAIVTAIDNTPEWQDFVAYLDASGLEAYGLINSIWGILDVANVRGTRFAMQRGFHDWMNGVIALIPTDQLIALIHEKLQTSSDFQGLWTRLVSEEFQAIVSAVAAVPEYQALLNKGREHGAPVDIWINLIKAIFGWQ